MQTNLYCQKAEHWLPGMESGGEIKEGGIIKGNKHPLGVIDMFLILVVVLVSSVCTRVKTYQIAYFKHVLSIVCTPAPHSRSGPFAVRLSHLVLLTASAH